MAKSGQQEDDTADKKSGGGGWWSSLFSGDKEEGPEEGDVDIEDLTASLEDDAESRKARTYFCKNVVGLVLASLKACGRYVNLRGQVPRGKQHCGMNADPFS